MNEKVNMEVHFYLKVTCSINICIIWNVVERQRENLYHWIRGNLPRVRSRSRSSSRHVIERIGIAIESCICRFDYSRRVSTVSIKNFYNDDCKCMHNINNDLLKEEGTNDCKEEKEGVRREDRSILPTEREYIIWHLFLYYYKERIYNRRKVTYWEYAEVNRAFLKSSSSTWTKMEFIGENWRPKKNRTR